MKRIDAVRIAAGAVALILASCAAPSLSPPPRLTAARPGVLAACTELSSFSHVRAQIVSATLVPAGTLKVGGTSIAEHCLVKGRVNERTSAVDGQSYAIGFEMRLPRQWNGRFFHQGNGGLDGFVQPAVGLVGGGGELSNALEQGFAVLSSDAGHNARQLPLFGRDPEARLNYGYRAVDTLTPLARALITAAYGRPPDRAYFGGCSNGGRHAMVAAARYAADYDGFLAGNPGFNLPKAALAQLAGAQQFAGIASSTDLASAFTPAERQLVARRINARCDALDGAADGIVGDVAACRIAFDVQRDVPTCQDARDGSCLSAPQKSVLAKVFAGVADSAGRRVYAPFPFDPGITGSDWANWKYVSSVTNRDPVAMAFVFQTPPAEAAAAGDPRALALGYDITRGLATIEARNGLYAESSLEFMTPPGDTDLAPMAARGGKLIIYHGAADGVFSPLDTVAWYDRLQARSSGEAGAFARVFIVPGMNHCRGGPATDQFDLLSPLVAWVEQGQAPDHVIARARGTGNVAPNPELPADWAADRTRPLCAYPQVARYAGTGDIERAENFACR